MHDLGYLESWALWLSGAKLEDFATWGITWLWWARIGKLLQFAGGAVVVLDLVGPERLLLLVALAHVFRHDNPRHPARWVAFFLVVIGFHFDLLGS